MTTATDTSQAEALCASLGVVCLAANTPARVDPIHPASTNAVASIQKLIRLHGREHVWAVLYALTQSENNRAHLTRAVIGAVSDVLLRNPTWADRLGEFCDVLDALDLTYLRKAAKRSPGIDGRAPEQRTVIAAHLQYLIEPVMDPETQLELVA